MQNAKIRLVGLIVVALALVANHVVARLEKPHPRLLPVETFPQTIGEWTGGQVEPVDPDIQSLLSTAHIHARSYRNGTGQSIQLMLITATDVRNFHNPTSCFPNQGWTLHDRKRVRIAGQLMNTMTADKDGSQVRVYYWLSGFQKTRGASDPVHSQLSSLRTRLVGNWEGESLFVRIIANADPLTEKALVEFISAIQPPLRSLEQSVNEKAPAAGG